MTTALIVAGDVLAGLAAWCVLSLITGLLIGTWLHRNPPRPVRPAPHSVPGVRWQLAIPIPQSEISPLQASTDARHQPADRAP